MREIPLDDIFSPKALRLAWDRYVRSRQKLSKDRRGIYAFGAALDENLIDLSRAILAGRVEPRTPAKFYHPKANGMQRTFTVLQVEDAIIYQALANAIATETYEQRCEKTPFIFANRLNSDVSQGTAILDDADANLFFFQRWEPSWKLFRDAVDGILDQSASVFEFATDITGFFDGVPQSLLLDTLTGAGLPEQARDWLGRALAIWSGTREGSTPGVGIPQGPDASAFFADLFLDPLDQQLGEQGLKYFRYVDDIRIFSHDRAELRRHLVQIDRWLKTRGLSLNAKKTSIQKVDASNRDNFRIHFEYGDELTAAQSNRNRQDVSIAEQVGSIITSGPLLNLFLGDLVWEARSKLIEIGESIENESPVLEDLPFVGKQTRNAVKIVEDMVDAPPDDAAMIIGDAAILTDEVLPMWLELLPKDEIFPHLFHIIWAVSAFPTDPRAEAGLLAALKQYQDYESIQQEILQNLGRFSPDDRTLAETVLPLARDTNLSWYPRTEAFLLVLNHARDPQLRAAAKLASQRDESPQLKRELALWSAQNVSEDEIDAMLETYSSPPGSETA